MSNPISSNLPDPLAAFLPPTRAWFEAKLGQPTPPQVQGWPAIQRGENPLLLAPTGSGKTLTAFLWGVDQLFRELNAECAARRAESPPVTRLLYISPLKALTRRPGCNAPGA